MFDDTLGKDPDLVEKHRLRIVLLPPEEWLPKQRAYMQGEGPDPTLIYRLLSKEHGIELEIIDPSWPKWMPLVHRHPIYRGLDPWRTLYVLAMRRDRDAVISVFESSATLLSLLRRWVNFKPRLVMWDIAPDLAWRPRIWVQRLTVPRVDNILLLSAGQIAHLQQYWSAGAKSRVIWQHVDTDFYVPVSPVLKGPVLAIGDDQGRDWPTLIEALAPLDIELVLKTRAKIKLPPGSRLRIRQVSQRLSFKALRDLYAQASIVVIPLSNTLNVSGVGSVLESMAMGKPLVISDNPPIRDYLVPGSTAEVVPVSDAVRLRAAVVALLADPVRMTQMGELARQRAVALYGKPAFARRLANTLRELVGRGAVAP